MEPADPRENHSISGSGVALRGRLEQFGLATVLTFLDLERRSGRVLLIDGDRLGKVTLRAGRVISARIEGSRRVNRAAIYELLSWDRGRFSFTQEDLADANDEVGAPTMQLLMEAARRTDEASAPAC
jgi:hypothetical protein